MIGEKIGPFLIEEKLGAGAMGVVYRAIYEPDGRSVAVKVISNDAVNRQGASSRFERESDILKQFKNPHIVQHFATGFSRSRNVRYYAMEYVPGENLERVLQQRGPLPWQEVVQIGLQVCDALQYAHERGVVHRDLKPSNLMATDAGQIKLTDFGIAKDLDRTALTADGRTLGTAAYMAPEQIRGAPAVSHKTDLYALGCLLYQLLTGKPPFEGQSTLELMHKHLDQPPPRPSSLNPDVPKALDTLVVQLMSKSPDARPWDAQAVGHALSQIIEKSERGEKVVMAFDHVPANPSRLGEFVEPDRSPTASPTVANGPRKRKRKGSASSAEAWVSRHAETLGLIGGLTLLLGLTAYFLWPPSQRYLFQRAEALMATPTRENWLRARDKYMADLDRRFPDHPYQSQLQEWRDQLLLEEGKGQARFLQSGLRQPRNDLESQYTVAYNLSKKDIEEGRDLDAQERWQRLTRALQELEQPGDDDRKWYLLAREQSNDLLRIITQRSEAVQKRLAEADSIQTRATLKQQVNLDAASDEIEAELLEAARIRREVLSQFDGIQSLDPLLERVRTSLRQSTPEDSNTAPAPSLPPPAQQPAP